jgi:hypothetical protein
VSGRKEEEAARQRIRTILRKASLYAWGFFAAAFATALGGAAMACVARAGGRAGR